MTNQHDRGAWPGATYNGFSGPAAPPRPVHEARPPPRRGRTPAVVVGGLAVALAGGLALGIASRPTLDSEPTPAAAPAKPAASGSAALPVEVSDLAPIAAPPSPKLEVLPSDVARAPAPAPAPAPVRVDPAVDATRPGPSRPAVAPPSEAAPPPMRAEAAQPSFNCRYARSPAERMVCGDAALAQLDRRLDRAFRRAVASGVPYDDLRGEQDDWLGIRELAARRSPQAVESIYRQRIAELNDMAR